MLNMQNQITKEKTSQNLKLQIVASMLLFQGAFWIFGQISATLILKKHGALTTFELITSGVHILDGLCCFIAGLLVLLKQSRIAVLFLMLAALLSLTAAVLGLVNPAWQGQPPLVSWTNAGMFLSFALVFFLTARWLKWQED